MQKKRLVSVIGFIFLVILFTIAAQAIKAESAEKGSITLTPIDAGKQVLVLIAIDDYSRWPDLQRDGQGPVNDAISLKSILTQYYYFDQVIELYNKDATKGTIMNRIKSYSKKGEKPLEEKDSLLIFFSGHGAMDKDTDKGYWIPYDGGIDVIARANWLDNSELIGLINKIKSDHILVISDSCFAGMLVDNCKGDDPREDNLFVLHKIFPYTARKILTAGSEEKVPAQSYFVKLLINELTNNSKSYYVKIETIYTNIEDEVIKKTHKRPLLGHLKDTISRDDSRFILFTKKGWIQLVRPVQQIFNYNIPDSARDSITKGIELLNVGNLEMAEKELLALLEQEPDLVDAIYALGIICFKKEEFKKAEGRFKQVLKFNPNYFDAYNYLGMIYTEKEDYEVAREYLENIVKAEEYQYPEYAYFNLATLEYKCGNIDLALRYIERGIALNRQFADLYNLNGMILEQRKDYDASIYNYKKALDLLIGDENEVTYMINLSRIYLKTGQKYRALTILEQALPKAKTTQEKEQVNSLLEMVNNL
jgi:tetratricopeptide (TPR) repeat protein